MEKKPKRKYSVIVKIGNDQTIKNFVKYRTNNIDNFLKFTADFDQRTKCSFEELNTRLYQVMSDVDQTTYKKYSAV